MGLCYSSPPTEAERQTGILRFRTEFGIDRLLIQVCISEENVKFPMKDKDMIKIYVEWCQRHIYEAVSKKYIRALDLQTRFRDNRFCAEYNVDPLLLAQCLTHNESYKLKYTVVIKLYIQWCQQQVYFANHHSQRLFNSPANIFAAVLPIIEMPDAVEPNAPPSRILNRPTI
jgi:hypothetical protein